MVPTAVIWLILVLTAGLGVVVYLIAADRQRFLTRFELQQWHEAYYLRALPNFLQALHDNHFPTPWPMQCNAVAAALFRFRAGALLKKQPKKLRQAFLEQHIILFALLEVLRPFLQDFVLSEQQRIAGERLLDMEDTIDRDRLLAFLENSRKHRDQFFRTLTHYDRQSLAEIIDRRLLPTLRATHANYQEHGYSLMAEFTQLRRWEEMTGVELVQELPVLPPLHAAKRPVALPANQIGDVQNS